MNDWYSPSEIRFTIGQIQWLIPHLHLLRNGYYPRNPRETVTLGRTQISHMANFVRAAEIASELDTRIQKAGWEGLIVEMIYTCDTDDRNFTIQHIASAMHVEIHDIHLRVRRALKYIRGFKRKNRTFEEWKNHKGRKR